jgi:hypothetical protein
MCSRLSFASQMPIAMFASGKDNGYKVTYDGGSLSDSKAGIGMKIYIGSNQVRSAYRNKINHN